MIQKTLIILKPDTVQRAINGKIIDRLETKWLKMIACKMAKLDEAILREHYSHIVNKPFFPWIVEYMTSSPVILQVWEWADSIEVIRLMLWVTNSRQALPWTIRWDYAMSIGRNVVHASESVEAAEIEIKRFFKQDEIYSYKRIDEDLIYEENEK